MSQAEIASGLKPLYSFGQLVVGPHNQVAVGACMEVLKLPGETYNPLFVYGPPGVGKTHLMQAVAHQILEKNTGFKVRYISAERFMSEILTAISEDRMLEVRRAYSLLDLLVIDDVQYMTESKISQEELFHVFNNMHQANHQVILAADRPPNQLTTLNKNIRSRLEWGLAVNVQVPDEPTRIEILKRKQVNNPGITMNDDMLKHVARNLKSNVRELEGFLKRIHAYVTLSHQPLTMDLVKSVVREILPEASEDAVVEPEAPVAPPVSNGHAKAAAAAPPAPEPVEEIAPPPPPPPPPAKAAPPAPPPVDKQAMAYDKLLESIEEVVIDKAPAPPLPVKPPEATPVPAAVVSKAIPPAPVPPAAVTQESPAIEESEPPPEEEGDAAGGHKEVGAVFFFPEGCEEALQNVSKKFQEVIKKHKLKFRLRGIHNQPYTYKGKVNYSSFVDVCKANHVPVAIVIGPPPENFLPQQDFYDLLTVTLDVQGVSLQLVNWSEINKDYRYLNLALDIALVRTR